MAKRIKDSRLRRKLRRFPEKLRSNIAIVMELSAQELAAELEAAAPKESGDLSEAVHYRVSRDGLSAQIGYANYPGFKRQWKAGGFKALWIEYGTKFKPAQPFIGPAFRAKLRTILDRIDRTVATTLRRASSGDF